MEKALSAPDHKRNPEGPTRAWITQSRSRDVCHHVSNLAARGRATHDGPPDFRRPSKKNPRDTLVEKNPNGSPCQPEYRVSVGFCFAHAESPCLDQEYSPRNELQRIQSNSEGENEGNRKLSCLDPLLTGNGAR